MRKVKPKDGPKILIKDITKRVSNYEKRKTTKTTVIKFQSLIDFLSNAEGSAPVIVMKKIYRFVDLFASENLSQHIICAKGCAHCCKVPVTVTVLEAAFIEWGSRKTHKHKMVVPKGHFLPRTGSQKYCPMLDQDTGTCTVYEYRPLACRTFAAFDSWQKCENPNNPHMIHTTDSNQMLVELRKYIGHNHSQMIGNGSPDIRDWFSQ